MELRCPLDDVLDVLRVRGAVMANLRARGPWGISLPRTPKATLHAVAAHIVASTPAGPTRTWGKVAEGQAGPIRPSDERQTLTANITGRRTSPLQG